MKSFGRVAKSMGELEESGDKRSIRVMEWMINSNLSI